MGLPSANAGSAKNISESGALLNTATEMDKQSPRVNGASTESGVANNGISTSTGPGDNGIDGVAGATMPGVPNDLQNLLMEIAVLMKFCQNELG